MPLNAAAIRMLAEKGLSAADLADLAEALETADDPGAAARVARHRATKKAAGTSEAAARADPAPASEAPLSDPADLARRVATAWNAMAAANGLDAVRSISGDRLKHVKARRREHGEPALFEAITKLGNSDWHCGRCPKPDARGTAWRADFDWLFHDGRRFQRILERSGTVKAAPVKHFSPEDVRRINLQGAEWFERIGRGAEAAAIRRRYRVPPPASLAEEREKEGANEAGARPSEPTRTGEAVLRRLGFGQPIAGTA